MLDNAENLFDGDLSTTQRENIITYKVRINSDRTVDILDEDYGVQ